MTMKIKFNIVGLSHGAKQQAPMEYARQAVGKHLALVMDNQNEFDPIAVAVRDGCQRIGFVAAQDSEEVAAALAASGKKMLLATCQGWGTKDESEQGLYLTAEVAFDAKMPIEQAYAKLYDDSRFTGWEYSGPMYCISQLSDLDSNTDMLEELLADVAQDTLSEDMAPMVKDLLADFLKNHCFDYSREMRRTRRRISELLSEIVGGASAENSVSADGSSSADGSVSADGSADSFLRRGLDALLADMGFITSSRYRERAARCFFIDTPSRMLRASTGAYDYSDRLDEVKHQLEAFPDNLYSYFKSDPVDFLRRIFYRRVPRKQMVQLLSGVILMVMNGRVDDVKQWGKHGDWDSLEAMKALGNRKNFDTRTRAAIVDTCLVAFSKCNKSEYVPFIRYQSDWYPVYRMLQDIGEYGKDDEGKFCKRLAGLRKKDDGLEEKSDVLEADDDGLEGKICTRKDLTQAACEIFEKTKTSEWSHLSKEELKDVQEDKFNRYCDIIEKFQSLLKEEICKQGFIYEDIVKQ